MATGSSGLPLIEGILSIPARPKGISSKEWHIIEAKYRQNGGLRTAAEIADFLSADFGRDILAHHLIEKLGDLLQRRADHVSNKWERRKAAYQVLHSSHRAVLATSTGSFRKQLGRNSSMRNSIRGSMRLRGLLRDNTLTDDHGRKPSALASPLHHPRDRSLSVRFDDNTEIIAPTPTKLEKSPKKRGSTTSTVATDDDVGIAATPERIAEAEAFMAQHAASQRIINSSNDIVSRYCAQLVGPNCYSPELDDRIMTLEQLGVLCASFIDDGESSQEEEEFYDDVDTPSPAKQRGQQKQLQEVSADLFEQLQTEAETLVHHETASVFDISRDSNESDDSDASSHASDGEHGEESVPSGVVQQLLQPYGLQYGASRTDNIPAKVNQRQLMAMLQDTAQDRAALDTSVDLTGDDAFWQDSSEHDVSAILDEDIEGSDQSPRSLDEMAASMSDSGRVTRRSSSLRGKLVGSTAGLRLARNKSLGGLDARADSYSRRMSIQSHHSMTSPRESLGAASVRSAETSPAATPELPSLVAHSSSSTMRSRGSKRRLQIGSPRKEPASRTVSIQTDCPSFTELWLGVIKHNVGVGTAKIAGDVGKVVSLATLKRERRHRKKTQAAVTQLEELQTEFDLASPDESGGLDDNPNGAHLQFAEKKTVKEIQAVSASDPQLQYRLLKAKDRAESERRREAIRSNFQKR